MKFSYSFYSQIYDKYLMYISVSVAAPNLWNTVPDNVKSANIVITFLRHFKTDLFNLAYSPSCPSVFIHLLF